MAGTDLPANPELLALMARVAREPEAERDLVRALAASTLVVPTVLTPAGEQSLWAGEDERGGSFLVAFTDVAAFEAWAGQGPVGALAMPAVELARLAVRGDAAALVINPVGPHGGRLERRMLDVVAAADAFALAERDVPPGDVALTATGRPLQVRRIGDPPGAAALERLRAAVAASPAVAEAWLLELVDPPPAHPLLVLVVPRDEAPIDDAIRDAVRALVPPDRFVDVVRTRGGDEDEVLASARQVGLAVG